MSLPQYQIKFVTPMSHINYKGLFTGYTIDITANDKDETIVVKFRSGLTKEFFNTVVNTLSQNGIPANVLLLLTETRQIESFIRYDATGELIVTEHNWASYNQDPMVMLRHLRMGNLEDLLMKHIKRYSEIPSWSNQDINAAIYRLRMGI